MGQLSMILENALQEAFLYILNRSIGGAFVILIVMLARLFLRRSPRIISYALWGVVALRLLCPFTIAVEHSPVPVTAEPVPADIGLMVTPGIETGINVIDTAVNGSLPPPTDITASVNPMQIVLIAASVLWLGGVILFAAADAVSLYLLRRRLRGAAYIGDGVWVSDSIPTPFVWGIFRARVCLPAFAAEEARPYILAHERMHIRRGDMLWKALGCVILTLHWFNPLVWLAFHFFAADMEAACDEAVLREAEDDIRIAYSEVLLSVAAGRKIHTAFPPSFGESDPKRRIKDVLSYRKASRTVWSCSVVFICIVSTGCLFSLSDVPLESEPSVIFSVHRGVKTESGEFRYDIPPFALYMDLPEGWTVSAPAEAYPPQSLLFTPVSISHEGEIIASVGFMPFEMYEGITPQDDGFYRMVYNQLMVSNLVTWDKDYTPIESTRTETFCTATCKILSSVPEEGVPATGWKRTETEGILAYDTELGVYIAMSFRENAVDEETWQSIAAGIRLAPLDE